MTSLALNDNNDIYLTPQGNLAVVTGADAVVQDCNCAMKTQLGEVALNTSYGVPTDATIWTNWNPAPFIAAARALLGTVPGVVAVKSFVINRVNGVAIYTAEIQTIYSPVSLTISGSLNQ